MFSVALTLKAQDEVMDTDMKQTFLQRYKEAIYIYIYDLQNDTLYIAWQMLKKKVQPALQDITNTFKNFNTSMSCYHDTVTGHAVVPQEIIHCIFPGIISLVPIQFRFEIAVSFIFIENVVIVLVFYI